MRNEGRLYLVFPSVRSERTSLVSGAIGESGDDPRLEEALIAQWQTQAPTERIGEFTYSLWKNPEPLPSRSPRFTRTFWVAAFLGCVAILILGRWVAERIRGGDFLSGQIFGITLLTLIYIVPLILVIVQKRHRPPAGDPMRPPAGIPSKAIPANGGSGYRGRSVGWLWFEGDRMHFVGVGFDFRLRREDFQTKGSLRKALATKEGAALRRPKGISSHRLNLVPGTVVDGTFTGDPKLWKEVQDEIASWESGTYTVEPSLFPPVRPIPSTKPLLGWAQYVAPSLFMASLLGLAGVLMPLEPTPGRTGNSPVVLALVGVLFGLMWPFLLWSTRLTEMSMESEVEKAIRRAHQPP